MERLLTPRQAATILNVSAKTLERWRQTRTGPVYIHVGHAVRYRETDLAAWVDANTVHATRDAYGTSDTIRNREKE